MSLIHASRRPFARRNASKQFPGVTPLSPPPPPPPINCPPLGTINKTDISGRRAGYIDLLELVCSFSLKGRTVDTERTSLMKSSSGTDAIQCRLPICPQVSLELVCSSFQCVASRAWFKAQFFFVEMSNILTLFD